MERAGQVLGKLKLAKQGVSDEELARSAWPAAVGKKIALRTRASVWCGPGWSLKSKMRFGSASCGLCKDRFSKASRRCSVVISSTELEFRIGVPRMKPTRAEALPLSGDEADLIRDPVFRSELQSCTQESQFLKITEQEVRYVADLANLRLDDSEIDRMAKDLDEILTHIDKLNELDTSNVEPMAQVLFDAGGDGNSARGRRSALLLGPTWP